MSPELHTRETPLSNDDVRLLRRAGRGRSVAAVMYTFMFVFFVVTAAGMALSLLDADIRRTAGVLLFVFALALTVPAVVLYRKLRRLPRSWRQVDGAIRGRAGKRIVSGTLTAFGPGDTPGVVYVFGDAHVAVALPGWNDILADSASGDRPSATAALTGVPVSLHLFDILPGRPPLLLRADYPGSADALIAVEEIAVADRETIRAAELGLRRFFFLVALVLALTGIAMPPLWLGVPVFLLLGLVLGARSPALKRARVKHSVRGVVEETITYRVPVPQSPLPSVVHNYRIGGELYRVGNAGDAAQPGQRIEIVFLDEGARGRHPIFFSAEDGPRQPV
ncbi:hypothetical protein ACILG0_19795 [Pseudomonadota bacterium AL_CKDN230030165-1A_HGKHYDSX7]